jgi:cytochrome o ubiquinol oxidase operon protein cyoD
MLKSYITGFVFSIVLTLGAFFVVLRPGFFSLGSNGVIGTILALALVQLLVQLFFFLDLGQRPARSASGEFTADGWKLIVFLSTISVVLILVVGSIWIMNHLNYNMMSMSPEEKDAYMLNQ